MKKAVLAVAVAGCLVWVALGTSQGTAASRRCPARPVSHQALLTIRRIHMRNQPVANYTAGNVAKGPVWDPYFPARPGSSRAMVIEAHDVTPVRCYGAHGPFYHLNTLRPGDVARIKWVHRWWTYRVVTYPFARRQCASKRVNDSYAHLVEGTAICAPYNRPMRNPRHREVIYFRCCWPRHTRRNFLYVRAVLVKPTH